MALITTKNIGTSAKQAVLTNTELDNNFININDELGTKVDSSAVEYPSSIVDLHRSPNAVTAMFIYDTSKDSDGGAWTDQCQGTSWYNETLSGNWLSSCQTELVARCKNAVLGPNLVDTLNTVAGWDYLNTNTTTDTGADGIRIDYVNYTAPGAQLRALSGLSADLKTNVPYEVTATVKVNAGSTVQLRVENTSSGILSHDYYITHTDFRTVKFYFYANVGSTWSVLRCGNLAAGESVWIKDVTVREVLSFSTIPNDYFQLISDGKFYSLSKNLLTTTDTLATQTQWLTAGTYTLSSTTGSSGSVVLSGAATGTHTAGTPLTFTVTTSGLVTFTVTGSVLTAQCELGSVATTYSANTGTTRYNAVYRGNKREFPKLSAIVAESQSITIYDLTEPNRPMWMRFPPTILFGGISAVNSSIYMLNGYLMVAGSVYFHLLNFIKDIAEQIGTNPNKTYIIGISNRTATTLNGIPYYYQTNSAAVMTSASCNAISACILPNAPIDPVTGLKIPTIAVATGGGISVIKHDGTVVNSSDTTNYGGITISQFGLSTFRVLSSQEYRYYTNIYPNNLLPGFSLSVTTNIDFRLGNTNKIINRLRTYFLRIPTSTTSATIQHLINNEQNVSKSITSTITNTYNTGYQIGDIRRTYMSSVLSGSTSATELVTNGTFDANSASWIGWTRQNGVTSYQANGYGVLPHNESTHQDVTVIPGKQYVVEVSGYVDQLGMPMYISDGPNFSYAFGSLLITTTPKTTRKVVKPTQTVLRLYCYNSSATDTGYFDTISVKEAIADGSYKGGGAVISGTLTKSSNTGTDLQWYSGFSNSNYAREHINPDLVFSSAGPTEWHLSSWMKIPTSLPTENFSIQTPNLLSNGTFTDSTGWSVSTGITISGGTLNFNTVTNTYAHYNSIISQIKPYYSYQVTVDIVSWVRGIPFMGLRGGALPVIVSLTTPGTHTFTLVSGASNIYGLLIYGGSSGSGGECVMDNLIIQEIGPAIIVENHIDDQLYDTNYYWDSDIVWE